MGHWYGKIGKMGNWYLIYCSCAGCCIISAITIRYFLYYFISISETMGTITKLVIMATYSIFGGIVSIAFTDIF